MLDSPPGGLYLYPQLYMARNVGRAPLRVHHYHPDRPIENEVYDSNVRLELRDEFELRPGESLERNGYRDVLDWARADASGFVLRLRSESVGNYEWAFDRETRAPKGVTVLDSLWSGTGGRHRKSCSLLILGGRARARPESGTRVRILFGAPVRQPPSI